MSGEPLSLDTNILIYAVDRDASERHKWARSIVSRAARGSCILTLQSVSEFYAAVTRKGIVSPAEARSQAEDWLMIFPTVGANADDSRLAMATFEAGRASFWDAMLVATAGRAGCSTLLSEDMSDGATLGGVTILNPFNPDRSGDIERLLGEERP